MTLRVNGKYFNISEASRVKILRALSHDCILQLKDEGVTTIVDEGNIVTVYDMEINLTQEKIDRVIECIETNCQETKYFTDRIIDRFETLLSDKK